MPRVSAREALAIAVALALLAIGLVVGGRTALASHSSSTIGLLAIDANSEGNTATSLGPIDGCASIEAGARISVDYIVDSIPRDRPLIGFEAEIRYDPQMLEVLDVDHDLLLAAVGAYSPFAGLSDGLPDSDGDLRISVLDTASDAEREANVETGAGVLARISFRARAAGVAEVAIALEREPLLYPLVLDTRNEMILAEGLGSASIAVDKPCPAPAAEPEVTDLEQVNEEILVDNPQLLAGPTDTASSPAAGESAPAPSGPTLDGPAGGPVSSPSLTAANSAAPNAGDGSDTPLIAAALVLLVLAVVALAAGARYLYRRSCNTPPGG